MFDAKKAALDDLRNMAKKMKAQKLMKVSVASDSPEGVKAGLEAAKGKVDEAEGSDMPKGAMDKYSGEHDEENAMSVPPSAKVQSILSTLSDLEKQQLYTMLHAEHEAKESPEFEAGEHSQD